MQTKKHVNKIYSKRFVSPQHQHPENKTLKTEFLVYSLKKWKMKEVV